MNDLRAGVLALCIMLAALLAQPQSAYAEPPGGGILYAFERGDSLAEIAERFGVSIRDLQRANGLGRSARVIPGTMLTIPTPDSPNATSPWLLRRIDPQPGHGKVIYVSLSRQRLWAYEDQRLVFEFLVSTGLATPEFPYRDTKPGVFRIKTKLPEAYAGLWGLRMPFWMGFYDAGDLENGFHAMPLYNNGRRVSWRVGAPGSYGCIVLNHNDAAALYRWAELGTLVVIRP
ncbi:MAG: L,D-transpeptidase family protein [Anaerolineae bacterium]|nr:L,D-transpeptidase family protein [Thermoflexales bacterium]MDW8395535.1 L,D-transpeptidase family protein [Anaerolineae bacterium]